MATGKRRVDRVGAWLESHRTAAQTVEVRADRGTAGDDTLLYYASGPFIAGQGRETAREIEERVQGEADANGHTIRASVIVLLEDDRRVSTTIQCRPNPESEEVQDADPTSMEAMSGTNQSQVVQAQRHTEALVRMSIQERETTLSGVGEIVQHVCKLVTSSLERQRAEEQRADEYRQREDTLRELVRELQKQLAEEPSFEMPPAFEKLAMLVAGRLTASSLAKQTPGSPEPEPPTH